MKSIAQINFRIGEIQAFFEDQELLLEGKEKRKLFTEFQMLQSAKLCLEQFPDEELIRRMKDQSEQRIQRIEEEFLVNHENMDRLPLKVQSKMRNQYYKKAGMKKLKQYLKLINFLLSDAIENTFVNS